MNLAQIVAQLETLVPKEEEHTVVQIIAQLEALFKHEDKLTSECCLIENTCSMEART